VSDYLTRVAAAAARATTTAKPPVTGPVLMPSIFATQPSELPGEPPSESKMASVTAPPVIAVADQQADQSVAAKAFDVATKNPTKTEHVQMQLQPETPAQQEAKSIPTDVIKPRTEPATFDYVLSPPVQTATQLAPPRVASASVPPIALPNPLPRVTAPHVAAQSLPPASPMQTQTIAPHEISAPAFAVQQDIVSECSEQPIKPKTSFTTELAKPPEVASASPLHREEIKPAEPVRSVIEMPPPTLPHGKPQPRVTIGRLEVQVINQPPPAPPPKRTAPPAPVQVNLLEKCYLERFSLRV